MDVATATAQLAAGGLLLAAAQLAVASAATRRRWRRRLEDAKRELETVQEAHEETHEETREETREESGAAAEGDAEAKAGNADAGENVEEVQGDEDVADDLQVHELVEDKASEDEDAKKEEQQREGDVDATIESDRNEPALASGESGAEEDMHQTPEPRASGRRKSVRTATTSTATKRMTTMTATKKKGGRPSKAAGNKENEVDPEQKLDKALASKEEIDEVGELVQLKTRGTQRGKKTSIESDNMSETSMSSRRSARTRRAPVVFEPEW